MKCLALDRGAQCEHDLQNNSKRLLARPQKNWICVVGLLFLALDKLSEIALKTTYLGDVYPTHFDRAKRDFTKPVSHYDYDLVPGACIIHNQAKGNQFEYANNAGFREPRPISLEKPADEFRVFLTGGSTAFGLGSTGGTGEVTGFYEIEYRETISHVMEKILNVSAPIPGKTIKVYNTAVWGHAYQHDLLRYITKLSRYKPDLVVSLDGVNEINPVTAPVKEWDYFREGQYNSILRQIFSYDGSGLASYLSLWLKNNTFLMALLWNGTDLFQSMETGNRLHRAVGANNPEAFKTSEITPEIRSKMISDNVNTVVRVVEHYHSALENDGVPHIFAVQPLLYMSKKPLHEVEEKIKAIEEHNQYYDMTTASAYKFIVDKIRSGSDEKGYILADFSEYFDQTSEWVFTDWCHLTSGANYLLAKQLSNMIKQAIFKKPLTEGDNIDDISSFFWSLTVTSNVLYAPPPDNDENGVANILTGYPSHTLYSSQSSGDGARQEITLDLQNDFKMSRMRIVWGDDDSVPELWAVDISTDNENWVPWINGDNKNLDNFSLWPAYEYYGAEPVQARYLRYRPIGNEKRPIRLRSLSAYR
ncbi:MAG: discoidin domain-containing protein [Desulfomonilaceae bacterium]